MTIAEVGRLLGLKLPVAGKKGYCPFRKHKRKDKTFRVFKSKQTGDEIYKCWSCDPPGNVGDAIAMFAQLENIDRRAAFHELQRLDFAVPSHREPVSSRSSHSSRREPVVPMYGSHDGPFLELDMKDWRRWKKLSNGLLLAFAEQRRLSSQLLRKLDVVEVERRCIGFGYRHPDTLLPCRVKVRNIDKKMFWIEPRGDDDRKACAPLYLAHDLERDLTVNSVAMYSQRGARAVIITEGEVDALTLRQMGYRNVVSLPDGAASANQVDLEPIMSFTHWLVATDADVEGNRAYSELRQRSYQSTNQVGRLRWCRLVGNRRDGEEVQEYKDANEALVAGFERDDFEFCIKRASESFFGQVVEVR